MTYVTFDSDEKTISGPGGAVNLATQEVKILSALLKKPGEVVLGLEMDRAMYGKGTPPFGALGVRLRRLRVKLESIGLPDVINTVRGVGLRWVGRYDSTSPPSSSFRSAENAGSVGMGGGDDVRNRADRACNSVGVVMTIVIGKSRNSDGWDWWQDAQEAARCGATDISPATEGEAECAAKILAADARGVMPSAGLGDRMRELLALRDGGVL